MGLSADGRGRRRGLLEDPMMVNEYDDHGLIHNQILVGSSFDVS